MQTHQKTLEAYFADIAASTPLSRAEEIALSARIQQGDLKARNTLVQANLRFVAEVAKAYRNRGLLYLIGIAIEKIGQKAFLRLRKPGV